MAYTLDYWQWEAKMEVDGTHKKPRPTPMRPVTDRVHFASPHFVIMEAITTAQGWKRRGKKLALIEMANGAPPTRIDPRLKSIRQIIAVREVFNLNHPKGGFIHIRYFRELMALLEKCESVYPLHFILKGVAYQPSKAALLD